MPDKSILHKTPEFSIGYRDTIIEKPEKLEQYHDSCELAFFIKADINVFLKDKQYKIKDGDVLFIDEYEIHKIIYAEKRYYRYVMNFRRSYAQLALRALGLEYIIDGIISREQRKISLNLRDSEILRNQLDRLIEIKDRAGDYKKDNINRAELKIEFIRLMISLYRIFEKSAQQEMQKKSDNQVKKILDYIDRFYMKEIKLEILEKEMYISKFHISHIFKEITGFTIVEYIQLKRVIEAQKMLAGTAKKIIDICLECGFNNIQHFYRVFKKISGCTPSLYRRTHLQFLQK